MPEAIVAPDVNANSSTEDVLKAADAAEQAKVAGESTAKEQGTEGQEDTTGKVDKTGNEVSDEEKEQAEVAALLKKGQPIPYERFKQFTEKRNKENEEHKQRIKEFEENQGDDELDAILKDPEVAALILKKQGFTDQAIAEKFKEAGIEAKKGEDKEPEFDLQSVEGWDKRIDYKLEKALDKRLGPVEKSLNETQTKEQMRVFGQRMDKEKLEAETLAKDVYGIEYGDEKDAKDPTTGAGKIMNYLTKHPEKVQAATHGILSKSDLLRLAIAEEGVKLGEKKGEKAEKDRVKKVREAAMEGGQEITVDKPPDKNSSHEYISAYHDKYPDWTP